MDDEELGAGAIGILGTGHGDAAAGVGQVVLVTVLAELAHDPGLATAGAVAKGAHAGKLVGAVATVTGGKGGGRPDNAMAGGRDIDKITDALAAAKDTLTGMLK